MCGIAGILALRPGLRVEAADLRLMAAQLSHRGPDDEAVYLDPQGRCGLAFRRLAVIDLATGRQPMSNETGRIWTICNGEIYNFRALRQRLVQLGHIFRSHSDAEVLVHL
jgi:asparagine synthase (glutamine-hydrolysing)